MDKKPRKGEIRQCLVCGKEHFVELNLIKIGKGKYCSKTCYDTTRKGRPSATKGRKVPFKPHPWKRGQVPKSAFKKGHVPWCAGKKRGPSPLRGKKTGIVPPNAIKPGQRISTATEFKPGARSNPEGEFKKGLVPWNKDINTTCPAKLKRRERLSPRMRQWAADVKARDNYTCRMCGQRGGRLHSDHILPFAYFVDFRYDLANGRTLCEECHKKTPTNGGKWYNSFARRFFATFLDC